MKELDSTIAYDTSELLYRLKGLGMTGVVLHIGSHPDDEDIGLLSYIAHKYSAKAVYWSATRGEAGQNRIAPYLGTELGIFRSWEANNARSIDGGECLYGPFIDFGYSKTAAECLSKWEKNEVLKEIVRVIRAVQPQIVVSRWRGIPDDFHGQHQAIGSMVYDAFEAAGNPARFPELSEEGLSPWQPQKLYYSCNNSGGDQSAGGALNLFGYQNPDYEKDGIVRINTGELDLIAGLTYQEQAWLAYNKHQSQGMGVVPKPGDFFYYFSLHKSLVPTPARENSLYDGLDFSLTGLADYPGNNSEWLRLELSHVKANVQEASQKIASGTINVAHALMAGLTRLRQINASLSSQFSGTEFQKQAITQMLEQKIKDFEAVICRCLGLRLECLADDGRITPGQVFQCDLRLLNQGNQPLDSVDFTLHLPPDWHQEQQELDKVAANALSTHYLVSVAQQSTMSCPYWLVNPPNRYRYQWPEGYIGQPFSEPLGQGTCQVIYQNQPLTLREPIRFREAFTGGSRSLPIAVIPPISIHPSSQSKILLDANSGMQSLELSIVVRSNMEHEGVSGNLRLEAPVDWIVEPDSVELVMGRVGDAKNLTFKVTLPENTPAADYVLRYVVNVAGRDYDRILKPVRLGTPGLPGQPSESNSSQEVYILDPATVEVKVLDVRFVTGLRYAYVKGIDENIQAALAQFNLNFHAITDAEMEFIDLRQFDAIVIGPNAYVVRESLRNAAKRFLNYVEHGGTLIVQYQGYPFEGKGFTPYPFKFNQPHDRTSTEEDPSPKILKPNHFLATYPNLITKDSFLGWHQEVGLYFFGEWDQHYESVFSCHDPGEDPKEGCLLITSYGQGTYIYTGFTFFRQIPIGQPGAFRLFANLLATPAARIRERSRILKQIPFFSFMSEDQLIEVAKVISECWMRQKTNLFHQGDPSENMYILMQGAVDLVKSNEENIQSSLKVEPNSLIGEMEVIGNLPRLTTAQIREDAHLLVINKDEFRKLMYEHSDIAEQVLKMLVTKIVG